MHEQLHAASGCKRSVYAYPYLYTQQHPWPRCRSSPVRCEDIRCAYHADDGRHDRHHARHHDRRRERHRLCQPHLPVAPLDCSAALDRPARISNHARRAAGQRLQYREGTRGVRRDDHRPRVPARLLDHQLFRHARDQLDRADEGERACRCAEPGDRDACRRRRCHVQGARSARPPGTQFAPRARGSTGSTSWPLRRAHTEPERVIAPATCRSSPRSPASADRAPPPGQRPRTVPADRDPRWRWAFEHLSANVKIFERSLALLRPHLRYAARVRCVQSAGVSSSAERPGSGGARTCFHRSVTVPASRMPRVPPVSADDPHVARRVVAGLLSMIVPGAGQAFAGAWRRGLVLFALFAFAAVPVVVVAAAPVRTAAWLLEGRLLPAALAVNILLLSLRLFAALDAWRIGSLAKSVPAPRLPARSRC